VIGAVSLGLAYTFVLGTPPMDAGMFIVSALVGLLVLLLTLPLVHPFAWFALRMARIPDGLACTLAGAVAFVVIPVVVTCAWERELTLSVLADSGLFVWPLIGVVAGYSIWQVTNWRV
jgi:hypothetical protein